ncbi:MAG: tetratricopeptide repeat protein, partial [Deltaproteobacteria bacterium]|nr:tetratricopeptide repeat protein [Deltaproteobacteria bacterium]
MEDTQIQPVSELPEALSRAMQKAAGSPEQSELWDEVEEQAREHNRPDEVAALFRDVLAGSLTPGVAATVGEHAVRFHDEWFEDAEPLVALLTRVLTLDPALDWAFDRLSLMLTMRERWTDLLALYDRTLGKTTDRAQRTKLLREAADIARDLAGQIERAIEFQKELHALDPADGPTAAALERLLERQGRFPDLVAFWTGLLDVLPPPEAAKTRARIAACWLDELSDPEQALAAVDALVTERHADADVAEACRLLERIVELEAAPRAVRRRALGLLKRLYDETGRAAEATAALERALELAEPRERPALHREIAERQTAAGRDEEAMGHWAALLVLAPSTRDVEESLRTLAEKTGRHDRYADALVAAADASPDGVLAVELVARAADVRREAVGDATGAVALYARVLGAEDAAPALRLRAARQQAALLERSGPKPVLLNVLERLASLSPVPDERKAALGHAAQLAEELGMPERALAAWRLRLEDDRSDAQAIDATVALLEKVGHWEGLIDALQQRAALDRAEDLRRRDLVRVAELYAKELNRIEPAIEAWRVIADTFGQDEETLDAVAALEVARGRWKEAAKLYEEGAKGEPDPAKRAGRLARLGDLQRERLNAPKRALGSYRTALEADATEAGARAGLHALIDDAKVGGDAVETLAGVYTATDEWPLLLSIVEPRVRAAKDDEARADVLVEAAKLLETRAEKLVDALVMIRRAFPLRPRDELLEGELVRLADATSQHAIALESYRDAIAAIGDAQEARARAADLRMREGALLEERLSDLEEALTAYGRLLHRQPEHLDASEAAIRVAARIGRWTAAAGTLVAAALARSETPRTLVERYAEHATAQNAWDAAAEALESAIGSAKSLAPEVAHALEKQLGLWHRDRRGDDAAAETALLRAVAHDGKQADTLEILAELQRRLVAQGREGAGRALVTTLLKLADAKGTHLAELREAAEVAIGPLADRELARPILVRLLEEASADWSTPDEVTLASSPGWHGAWALEQLVETHVAAGEHKRALDLLVDGAKLPVGAVTSRALRHRAAEIAAGPLEDPERAIALHRGILEESPAETRSIGDLVRLYRKTGKLRNLLDLQRHALGLVAPAEARLVLRLDMAEVLRELGDEDERVRTLRENLEDSAGHEATIAVLTEALVASSRHAELADVLSEQATRLTEVSRRHAAAALWSRVAELAESPLGDVPRAIEAHEKALALETTDAGLDALARLHSARGDHTRAIARLEERLERALGSARAEVSLRLARAYDAAGRRDDARTTLERALAEDPSAHEVRTLLATMYRARSIWPPLAPLLREGADLANDDDLKVSLLRESADIYRRKLSDLATALPILEAAVALSPSDRPTRTALAETLRSAGRLDESREILEGILEEFGRRRPPERAAVHYQLGQLARAQGKLEDALVQLEAASAIDMGGAAILRSLGDVARELGQLERAERAYRALLLIVRRQQSKTTDTATGLPITPDVLEDALGPSEVLFDLHRIAALSNQPDRAKEMLESAFEAAGQSELEARRLERTLRQAGERELLLRVLGDRAARTSDPEAAADVLAERAEVLSELGRAPEALDTVLDAIGKSPLSEKLHGRAREIAASTEGGLGRYQERLREVGAAHAQDLPATSADVYLRLGRLLEGQGSDVAGAIDAYERAEETGVRRVDAWRALDRLRSQRGDGAALVRVLRHLVDDTTADEMESHARTDALYRLADLLLGDADARTEGVDRLTAALDQEPDAARALAMLRRSADAEPAHEPTLRLFERVARGEGDDALLLEALERSSILPDTPNDTMREAVELATRTGDDARVERLLERTIELARSSSIGVGEAVWALVALADRRESQGNLSTAVRLLREAADVADGDEAFQLGLRVAVLAAGQLSNFDLAAETYEKLLERDPSDPRVWEPLLDVYRLRGDRARLEALIDSSVSTVTEVDKRVRLRLERARLLLDDPARVDDAESALRDVLDEEPDHAEAAQLLGDLLEGAGRTEDLAEFLSRQLDGARDRSDKAQVATLSMRLGKLLEQDDRVHAMDVYRQAVEIVPDHAPLLRALTELHQPDDDAADYASVLEKLLAIESGDRAAELALTLANVRESLSDDEGVGRALDRGFRACPTHLDLRERLLRWYGDRGEWSQLAGALVFDAQQRSSPSESASLLRQAATVHREKLADPAAATDILLRAREIEPGSTDTLLELARAMNDAGNRRGALDELTSALESRPPGDRGRPEVLRLRAEMLSATGDDAGAVTDLEEAVELGGTAFLADLAAGLDRRRARAGAIGEYEVERAAVMRLGEVLTRLGDHERSRRALVDWVRAHPNDREAVRMLA